VIGNALQDLERHERDFIANPLRNHVVIYIEEKKARTNERIKCKKHTSIFLRSLTSKMRKKKKKPVDVDLVSGSDVERKLDEDIKIVFPHMTYETIAVTEIFVIDVENVRF